jgi:uncharacterized protein YndB with AHSA1/START domain
MQNRSFAAYVSATPGQIWQILTDPELMSEFFFGLTIESEWRVGSRLVLRSPEAGHAAGYVIEAERNRRLMFALTSGVENDGATAWMTWEMAEIQPGVTRVALHHDDLDEPDADQDEDILRLLGNLKTVAESGRRKGVQPRVDPWAAP